jgi:hypothetical protein
VIPETAGRFQTTKPGDVETSYAITHPGSVPSESQAGQL